MSFTYPHNYSYSVLWPQSYYLFMFSNVSHFAVTLSTAYDL